MSLRISGNRLLKTPPGQAARPTLGRVREALFNIWQGEVQGCRWLDLCAGSGAMGAEALCHGADRVVGLELSPAHCAVIQENWQKVAQPSQTFQILRAKLPTGLGQLQGQRFDRIYFDPPYQAGLYDKVLAAIVQLQLLAPGGELAAEHDAKAAIAAPPGLVICRQKIYGNTGITFFAFDN